MTEIREAQSVKREIKEGIGVYRGNRVRFRDAEKTLKELERLLSIVSAQRVKKLNELEKSKVTNVLAKIKALCGISALSKQLFGTRPTITATWRIIWATLLFVVFFTVFHFFTWRARSRYMGEENAEETKGKLTEVGVQEGEKENKK